MLLLDWRLKEDPWWHKSLAARDMSIMFWRLLLGPVIGGQTYKIPPLTTAVMERKENLIAMKRQEESGQNAELSERSKYTKEHCVKAASGSPSWMTGFDLVKCPINKG